MIQVYATGCGPTQPQVPDSQPPTGPASATATVKAYVSVLEAPVQYAGAHPQFPDICQVNAMVPNAAYITGQVRWSLRSTVYRVIRLRPGLSNREIPHVQMILLRIIAIAAISSFLPGAQTPPPPGPQTDARPIPAAQAIGGGGVVTGTVFVSSTGQPLRGATVSIDGSTAKTTTDTSGSYRFQIPAGTHRVPVSWALSDPI